MSMSTSARNRLHRYQWDFEGKCIFELFLGSSTSPKLTPSLKCRLITLFFSKKESHMSFFFANHETHGFLNVDLNANDTIISNKKTHKNSTICCSTVYHQAIRFLFY
nr:AlNc14C45G3667 [Albugo laibachii Nc14]|eukprot:CCA18109.1 AlNc14C45G3667 [Albugo laibachii Nc14]